MRPAHFDQSTFSGRSGPWCRYGTCPVTLIRLLSHTVMNSSYLMRPDQRIVAKIPLTELWDERGALPGERIRHVDGNLIRGLMGTGQVQFIVADCGAKLNWIPMPERFEFWKTVRTQVADPSQPILLKQFPNETAIRCLGVARKYWGMYDFARSTPLNF